MSHEVEVLQNVFIQELGEIRVINSYSKMFTPDFSRMHISYVD